MRRSTAESPPTDQEREGTSAGDAGGRLPALRRRARLHASPRRTSTARRSPAPSSTTARACRTLRAALRARDLDVVIAYAVDRLSRDQVHIWLLLDEIDRADARLEMVTESFDDSPTGKFLLSARAFAAEVERQKIRERTGRGRLGHRPGRQAVRSGHRSLRLPPRAGRNRREIHKAEAAVVRDIFESYARGEPMRAIIRRLNESGVPSPGAGKRNLGRVTYWGKGRRSTACSSTRCTRARPTPSAGPATRTAGASPCGSARARSGSRCRTASRRPSSPPSCGTTVQVRLATNKGESTRNQTRPYLLRGLMVCASCGRKLRSSPEHGRRTYRCASRETPAGPCGAPRVPADEVERWVWDEVAAILQDPADHRPGGRASTEGGRRPGA